MERKLKPIYVQQTLQTKGVRLFSLSDVQRVFGVSLRAAQEFTKDHRKDLFFKIRNGLYALRADPPAEEAIANRLYAPSYISFEYALSRYGIIPESVYGITSATTRITREFIVNNKSFVYSHIKKQAYSGYKTEKIGSVTVLIAEPEKALAKIEIEGIKTEIVESKSTSGRYLAIFRFEAGEYKSQIQIEVSLRKGKEMTGSAALVQSDLVMPYTLIHLKEDILVAEKIRACITRGKVRDFYDLYFILRSRMAFKDIFIQDKQLKAKILTAIQSGKIDFKRELKILLPVNQHMIIKGFPGTLVTEIERNLAG